ncbi:MULTISPECIES: DUF2231 domain-containing protein [unclassified Paracoccus (in: a-proteobacteria)]|uniref:DUF2231 domain-containing protein n=1 Tax=unclassified Paracoccus (in: a-proteobacteria) TaxID=2688777 RepID=UPI0015FFD915|nr:MULTISPECIES: DUF2231 domain-containing protein [unclassified Paracoccus (in: a-proteobacteria)]MBB1490976.1 hypothetical protein [Paracoccus sp. MC1854]MBB1498885.1 hypothetical protein [Paracoccus sp. MC1862]QQO45176.1 hypothetical protein JGR78_01905 [Paracoccus sp. MC1862]
MVAVYGPIDLRPIHPIHAILLSFPFPLFLGTLLSDFAYRATYEIQWANFAQWLNAGGLLVGAFVGLWALINLFRRETRGRRRTIIYFVVLLAMWVLGLMNAFIHAKDAWAIMPEAIWLSAISAFLALVAAWIGYSGLSIDEVN